MTVVSYAPVDHSITLDQLHHDPYAIYKKLRAEAPILHVESVGRTFLTKAADTKYVKELPEIFSANDPNTPMERAFQAHTLMRKDGVDHARERNAMVATFSGRNIKDIWIPAYTKIAEDYVDQLPRGETIDLFPALAGPFAARCLAHVLGIPDASDEDMQRWSQALIDGAGNFGWEPGPFEKCDAAHAEMNACINAAIPQHHDNPNQSALAVMVNSDDPIAMSQIVANIKIAIGGGINEPRDALLTVLYGLLTNPDQLTAAKQEEAVWSAAFEEAIRWVAPIQVSSRLVLEDVEIRDCLIPKGDVLMTIQASANHDEELYENPHLFDAFRPKKPHQAFGNGPHFCMGTHISRRMIGTILLPLLFDRFPNMKLSDPEDVMFRGFGFRGPINLPVTLN